MHTRRERGRERSLGFSLLNGRLGYPHHIIGGCRRRKILDEAGGGVAQPPLIAMALDGPSVNAPADNTGNAGMSGGAWQPPDANKAGLAVSALFNDPANIAGTADPVGLGQHRPAVSGRRSYAVGARRARFFCRRRLRTLRERDKKPWRRERRRLLG